MVNRNLFMARKKQWGTNPTEMQWPKIWRPCHTVRAEKAHLKEVAEKEKEAALMTKYNENAKIVNES